MGIGKITLDAAGSVTEPTGALKLSLGSAKSTLIADGLPVVTSDIPPNDPGVVFTNGFDYIRHMWESAIYRTGGLAPSVALTAVPSGVQATSDMDLDATNTGTAYVLANGDEFWIGPNTLLTLVTTLPAGQTPPTAPKFGAPWTLAVKVGGTNAATFQTLQDVFDGNGSEGVDYQGYYVGDDPTAYGFTVSTFDGATDVGTLTFRATDFGTSGNSLVSQLSDYTAPGASNWTSQTSLGSLTTTIATTSPTGVFTGGTDTDGSGPPAAGTYDYIYQWQRKADGALTGSSPATGDVTQGTAQDIDLTFIADSSDSDFDFSRWSRTLKNQKRYYRGDEIARAATNDDTDTLTDTTLLTNPIIYEQRKFRTHGAGHIPRHRWAAQHQHRMFYGGHRPSAPYTAGTATFSNGSRTVTIAGGYPRAEHEGRTMLAGSESEEYLIVAVSESAQTYTLAKDYEGVLTSGAAYEVRDSVDGNTMLFSEVRKINQAPATNTVGGIISRAGEGTLAAVSIWEVLVVFTRDGVYRLIGQTPNSYALRPAAGAMGTISSRSVVVVDDVLYWQAPDGIYRWGQGGQPENITRPVVMDGLVRGINETIKRVNAAHSTWAHAHYSPDERVIRFFCPLDNDVVPYHAFVYDIQTGAITVDRVPGITASGTVTKGNGDRVTLLGSVTGEIFHADIGNSDGAFGFEPKTTATAGTTKTWTDSAASFPTTGDGLKGLPFFYGDADSDFNMATIASNTGTVLTFTHQITAPAAGDQGYVGGIWGHVRSGRAHFGIPDEPKTVSNLRIAYSPDTDGKLVVAVAADQDALAVPAFESEQVDLSDAGGTGHILMNTSGRAHQFEIHAPESGCDPHILNVAVDLHARGKATIIR